MSEKKPQPVTEGYQPLQKGYQPKPAPQTVATPVKINGGYQPATSQAKPTTNPPPKKP